MAERQQGDGEQLQLIPAVETAINTIESFFKKRFDDLERRVWRRALAGYRDDQLEHGILDCCSQWSGRGVPKPGNVIEYIQAYNARTVRQSSTRALPAPPEDGEADPEWSAKLQFCYKHSVEDTRLMVEANRSNGGRGDGGATYVRLYREWVGRGMRDERRPNKLMPGMGRMGDG
jgi:hypothetical protein